MSYKFALLAGSLVLGFGLFPREAATQTDRHCPPPCYPEMYKPCPTCGRLMRCSCPPRAGTSTGGGSYGKAEIHRKNVPQAQKNKSPPYD